MRWFDQLRMRILMLFGRKRAATRLDDELSFHLEHQIAENIAAGMSPEEARHAALRTFGNPALLREQSRATWSWNGLESLARDLRYSARTLRRTPTFSLMAILVIALCIGAATSLFTIVRSVLLKPLPFRDPGRLVMVYEHFRGALGKPGRVQLQLCFARRLLRLARADPRLSGHGRVALVAVQPDRRAR